MNPKIAFVTNICPHYRVKAFENLSQFYPVDFYFFSAGKDWFWQQEHGIRTGNFQHHYLPGFYLGHTRITPSLPIYLLKNNYDIYIKCINGLFALPLTYLIARFRKKPFILWTGVWMRLGTFHQRILLPFTIYLYQHADAIVVYGKHVKNYLVQEGVSAKRIFIAGQAVDNENYSCNISENEKKALYKKLSISDDQKIVLFLGRLEPEKGLNILLEAFASLERTDSTILFAGNGSLRASLEDHARQLGVSDYVRFANYVQIEETPAYYASAWIDVLPSITTRSIKETWGLVVNEAFNQGLPVIATDAVGAAVGGLLQHEVNGLIVPEQNIKALADAIKRMLDEPDLRNTLGKNAKKTVESWNYENMVLGFVNAIEFVLQKNPK